MSLANFTRASGIQGEGPGAWTREVDRREVASNQLNRMLRDDSAYMQNARLRGQELANSRNLMNSALAAGNAQRASIEAAAPIAIENSRAYREAAGQNLQSLSSRDVADVGARAQLGSARIGAGATKFAARERSRGALALARLNNEWQGGENILNREHDVNIQDRQFGENASERDWRSGESSLDREHDYERQGRDFEENARDRDWRSDESQYDRDWRSDESQLDREDRELDRELNRYGIDRSTFAAIHNGYAQERASVNQNPDISEAQRQAALRDIDRREEAQYRRMGLFQGQDSPPIQGWS